MTEQPALVAGFVRATNRAVIDALADPQQAIAAVKQREPLIDVKAELERWAITARYVAAPDTLSHGLGDVRKPLIERQVDEVVQVYGLKSKPSADAIYNLSFLPPKREREVKA